MAQLTFYKTPSGQLAPADPQSIEFLQKKKTGAFLVADVRQPRNPKFHRKIFAFLNWAFENIEVTPVQHRGQDVEMPFERFRAEMVVLAGFFDYVATLDGGLRKQPHSLEYGKCNEQKAQEIYSHMLDVAAQKLFQGNFTPEELDEKTEQWLSFT